jgi:transposase
MATPQQVAMRCRIVLAAADGQSDVAIAQQVSVNRKTVILWRQRFVYEMWLRNEGDGSVEASYSLPTVWIGFRI